MPERKLISKNILPILILMIVIALIFIGFDLYLVLNKGVEPKILEEQTKPFNPSIDQTRLEKLQNRLILKEEDFAKMPPTRMIKFELPKSSSPSAEKP